MPNLRKIVLATAGMVPLVLIAGASGPQAKGQNSSTPTYINGLSANTSATINDRYGMTKANTPGQDYSISLGNLLNVISSIDPTLPHGPAYSSLNIGQYLTGWPVGFYNIWGAPPLRVYNNDNAILGAVYTDASTGLTAQPAGVTGVGFLALQDGYAYGLYGVARASAANVGGVVKNEFDGQNYSGIEANLRLPMAYTIGESAPLVIGAAAASRGSNGASIGYSVGTNAVDSSFFYTGLYMRQGAARNYGIYVDNGPDALYGVNGPRWSGWFNNPMTPQLYGFPTFSLLTSAANATPSSGSRANTLNYDSTPGPVVSQTTASSPSGSTQINIPTAGLQIGMTVSGNGVAPGSMVTALDTRDGIVTVTPALTGAVANTESVTFTPPSEGPTGVTIGMSVSGNGIPSGSFVTSVSQSTITLNQQTNGVAAGTQVSFSMPLKLKTVVANTGNTIQFSSTYGLQIGMTASSGGASLGTVVSMTESQVTFSNATALAAGSMVAFTVPTIAIPAGHDEFTPLTLQGGTALQSGDGLSVGDNATMAMMQILGPQYTQQMYIDYAGDYVIPGKIQIRADGNIGALRGDGTMSVFNRNGTLAVMQDSSAATMGYPQLTAARSGMPVIYGVGGSATNQGIAVIPAGTGALTTGIPNSLPNGGNPRGSSAVDLQMVRTLSRQVASGAQSVIPGGQNNAASGDQSVVAGGLTNTASGLQSAIVGGQTNVASGAQSVVSGGQGNTASGSQSGAASGLTNMASGLQSVVTGGQGNTASGPQSMVAGGLGNTASGSGAMITGGASNLASGTNSRTGGASANDWGRTGADCFASGDFATAGDQQACTFVLHASSSSATAERLTSDGNAPNGLNCIRLQNNEAAAFDILLVGNDDSNTGNAVVWTMNGGLIARGSGPMSTIYSAPPAGVTSVAQGNGSSAALAVSADRTNGCVNLSVTPPNADTWHWVARVVAAEVQ